MTKSVGSEHPGSINPPPELVTDRLRLRVARVSDADAIFEEYAADPEVTRYMTWVPHEVATTVEDFLRLLAERHVDGREFSWVLTKPTADRAFGMIGARPQGHMVDIGYVLAKRYWNRGYMTEAVAAVSDWFLSQAEIYRVWAVCDKKNLASARVLEKAGFEREGLLRRWIVHPNCADGPRDCCVFARTR